MHVRFDFGVWIGVRNNRIWKIPRIDLQKDLGILVGQKTRVRKREDAFVGLEKSSNYLYPFFGWFPGGGGPEIIRLFPSPNESSFVFLSFIHWAFLFASLILRFTRS